MDEHFKYLSLSSRKDFFLKKKQQRKHFSQDITFDPGPWGFYNALNTRSHMSIFKACHQPHKTTLLAQNWQWEKH